MTCKITTRLKDQYDRFRQRKVSAEVGNTEVGNINREGERERPFLKN